MAKITKISSLAPAHFPKLPEIAGVGIATAASNTRYKGRDDLFLASFAAGTAVAGVFTRSKAPSAPVDWCRRLLQASASPKARALVVNAGNANAFTGRLGAEAVQKTAEAAAKALGCGVDEVYLASTGVIGVQLPVDGITAPIAGMAKSLKGNVWDKAAEAISTTDTFPKGATRTAKIDGQTVTINGIAKGSGMIAPDMATLLGFVFTDAKLPAAVLQTLLSEHNETTFNCVTVDSDTSTSDTLMAFATGQGAAHDPVIRADDPRLQNFREAFHDLLLDLAHQVVKDGEGASKFITINITGAEDDKAAKRIAFSVANSPLVKTAIAGEDANWGRIVAAVGKAGEAADRDRLVVRIGGQLVAKDGMAVADYNEAETTRHLKGHNIDIDVDVGVGGPGIATVWTCDLTHEYISINADYRS
jgi:glutamate N-acetyltransferase/amino-acid N-acetyltransferase